MIISAKKNTRTLEGGEEHNLEKKTSLLVRSEANIKIKNNMIMKQMRWKNHLFQLFVTRKERNMKTQATATTRISKHNFPAAWKEWKRFFMLHFKLHTFIFICFPTYRSAPYSSGSLLSFLLFSFKVFSILMCSHFFLFSIIFDIHIYRERPEMLQWQ